jgi:hypothetical protein
MTAVARLLFVVSGTFKVRDVTLPPLLREDDVPPGTEIWRVKSDTI